MRLQAIKKFGNLAFVSMKESFDNIEIMKITEDIINLLGVIDKIYISDSFFAMMNEQSCDCDEVIIKSGKIYVKLTGQAVGEDGKIVFEKSTLFEKDKYPYEVDLNGKGFKFDKLSYLENGMIDGIRFATDEIFLFVFAMEHSLVLTMSKLDLFEKIETDYPEQEATLTIIKS